MKNDINTSIFKQEKMQNEIAELKNEILFKKEDINKLKYELTNISSSNFNTKETINRMKSEFNDKSDTFSKFCNKIYNSTAQIIDKLKNNGSKNGAASEHLYTSNFSDNIVNNILI